MKLIRTLDKYDKDLSNKIHSLELPVYLEVFVYISARLFNPDFICIYFVLIFNYEYYYHNDSLFVLKPVINTLSLLIFTLVMKHVAGRPRPEKKKLHRIKDLRDDERNFSMPSGDSLQ